MSSFDLSNKSGEDGEREVSKYLSELETQRKEAGDIVQRWFRFRARRELSLFYSFLSFVPRKLSAIFSSHKL